MGKPYRGTYNNSEKQKYDEEMLAALEDEQMEVEQKLLRRYCEAGKRMLREAAEEQQEINKLAERLIENRRKRNLFFRFHCPFCEKIIEQDSRFCRYCGKSVSDYENESMKEQT